MTPTDTSEEYVASIFRAKESSPSWCLIVNMDYNINIHNRVLSPVLSHNCESWSVTEEEQIECLRMGYSKY